MPAKKKETPSKKGWMPSNKQLALISTTLVVVIILAFAIPYFLLKAPPTQFSLKAGVIDQLSEDLPDPAFVANITAVLEDYGFNVTYHSGALTVDWFRNLASYNYGVIVLRAHSAIREGLSTVDLFTSEKFSSSAHVSDQQKGFVTKGILNYTGTVKEYFAITPKFIEGIAGTFPKSIVVAMGCNSLKSGLEQMAAAFNAKGAKAYLGWTGFVEYPHTDSETVKLMRNLLVYNKTLGEAVDSASEDAIWASRMRCYPEAARNVRVSDLLAENASATPQTHSTIPNWHRDLLIGIVHEKRRDPSIRTSLADLSDV